MLKDFKYNSSMGEKLRPIQWWSKFEMSPICKKVSLNLVHHNDIIDFLYDKSFSFKTYNCTKKPQQSLNFTQEKTWELILGYDWLVLFNNTDFVPVIGPWSYILITNLQI